MTNNSANKNSTQKSDAIERESAKRKTDNESDDLSKQQINNIYYVSVLHATYESYIPLFYELFLSRTIVA